MTKCPHCDEEIDYLRFKRGVTEYGTANLDGYVTETEDSDDNYTELFCPECDEEIDTDELIHEDDEKKEEEKVTPELLNRQMQ